MLLFFFEIKSRYSSMGCNACAYDTSARVLAYVQLQFNLLLAITEIVLKKNPFFLAFLPSSDN